MSSSEDSDAGRKRKRKVRRLEDSPASTSSASPIIGSSSIRRRRRHRVDTSSNDSDNSPILNNHRRKIMKVNSDSESESDSDSDIGHSRTTKPRPLETDSDTDDGSSQWESDFSDHETEMLPKNGVLPANQNDSESEFSDGQSEKCPICLVSFKRQEIGTPESCDHTFCLECIQEWSKNMNTCPVDRQEYSLILVRDHLNGKVTRQIPIERPVPQNEVDIFEDPTFCEICGSNDQEDRMLLCDGCDLGFHLFCLTPPLSDVPAGSWYCNDCSPNSDNNSSVDVFELQLLFEEDDDPLEHQLRPQRRTRSTRLLPRTWQTERIRRRVQNNRHQNALANQTPKTNVNGEYSRNTNQVTSSTPRKKKKKSRKSKSAQIKYKTVYEIDKVTGLTVAVQKRMRKKRKKVTKRSVAKPKTVKTRLAQQLGICAPRTTNQNLPDVKIPNRASSAAGNINGIRHDAGIPTLHLFGQNNDLDYFTDEDEYSLGSQVLIRRAPTISDVAAIRRTITRKNIIVPEVVSSTSDLLDSILNSQEQLYARNASYSVDSSGKFKISAKSKSKDYIDVTKEQVKGKETPYYNPNRNYNRYNQNQNNYNRPYQNRYQRPSNNYYHSSNQNYNNYNTEPSSSMNYSNFSNDGGDDYPQDYSRRTLCATSDPGSEENEEERNQNEESELDIYSDIETVTTSKAEESEYRPLSPPPLPNFSGMGCLEDDNDSEPDMVIDDTKVQEQDNQTDYNAEAAVSSTVGFEPAVPVHTGPVPFPTAVNQSQSDPVQSSLDTIKSSYQYYNEDSSDGCPNANIYSREPPVPPNDEDADSDDGCPNFSIYSKESKTMALHTDISSLSTEKQDHQVGEISSSPNFEVQHCNQDQQPDLPVSDQMYDPEETFNESEEDENLEESHEESTLNESQEKSILDESQEEESTLNTNQLSVIYENEEEEEEESVMNENKEHDLNESHEESSNANKEQNLDDTQPKSDQLYNPEALYSPDRDVATPTNLTPTNLDHTYDPENCIRTDETLNTDAEKTVDADNTTFDPENTYDETSDSIDRTADMERAIFGFKKSDNNETITEDRYDPALPFSDEIDDSSQNIDNSEQAKPIDNVTAAEDPQFDSLDESCINPTREPDEDEIKKTDLPEKRVKPKKKKQSNLNSLYSDSEDDESVVKKGGNAFVMNDINQMTEDISEEERSYTPCLDEKSQKEGLEGLDTELISDEDRNDFDEANELKTVYDGDALEINAKESELDFARPEDYEEGEIVDKNKDKETQDEEPEEPENNVAEQSTSEPPPPEAKKTKKRDNKEKSPERERDKGNNKENENSTKNSFKRLSKSNKDRNYRDKEKRPSSPKGRSKEREYNRKDKKKEKRREIERYNVRAIISEKPRPLVAKDQFGRDIRTTPSRSRSRSYTPPLRSSSGPARSPSKPRRSRSRSRRSLSRHRSLPKEKTRKRRKSRSRNFRSASRSRSPQHKKGSSSAQKSKKRKRSDDRYRKRKSDDKFGKSKRRVRSRSRHMSRSASPMRRPRARERLDWTPMDQPQMSPSWTPPRAMDNAQMLRNKSLTVTVNNSKKKKDRRKRRNKDTLETRQKKRRQERDRTPPLSKEVFASGDNILVSVSFNNDSEVRDITTRDKRKNDDLNKRRKKKKNRRDLSGIKPVAIIDLDRSPFRELTPSPKQIIVLTDSENEENEMRRRNVQGSSICDSSQQVGSPERGIGPKTPPEPQVKFSLAPKPPQIRAINNPLIDPEEIEINVSSEMTSRISPGIHKGPNTPPEPPNSPPSSPDAYDPFEPTKSRSPTPGPQSQDGNKEKHDTIDSRAAIDLLEKSMNPMPENKSLTPPLADIQPADSQSSVQVVTPDSNIDKSPDRPQLQTAQQVSKPVAQTIPFSSVPTPLNSSTPIVTNLPPSRINILNSTVISPPVASPIPQRIVLPNQIKSSSVKISPTKATIKSTPIKPMLSKTTTTKFTTRKRTQNGSADDILLDFDSPYSPGSSDYEDLFEPPSEIVTKPVIKGKAKTVQKHPLSTFDALFGGSPSYKKKKYPTKKISGSGKTKTVGVKLDEDNLKILDELPNSAVEMQVKDKFLKKLNRQERVVEEVKLVLKPHYNKKRINKEEYKDILRRSVPKICHNKSGEINPTKIKNLIEAYVRKIRHSKKVTSSSSINPQKM